MSGLLVDSGYNPIKPNYMKPDTDDVLLDIPYDSSELDNIYAVNLSGKIIWRIEKVAKKFPKLRHDPYAGISMLDDKLLARQFYGQRYLIDPATGKIIERYTVGRDW